MASLLDYHDNPALLEHARGRRRGQRDDLAEVEIEGQDDAPLGGSLGEDLPIGESLQALLSEMGCVMRLGA